MSEKREDMLLRIIKLYEKFGIKNLSMDDIARELHISKRTIYEQFGSRKELIQNAIAHLFVVIKQKMEIIHNESQNVIEILYKATEVAVGYFSSVSPAYIYDLDNTYADIFRKEKMNHHETMKKKYGSLVVRGIKEGLFEPNLNPELCDFVIEQLMLYIDEVKHLEKYKYTPKEIFSNIFLAYFKGISTRKGREIIDSKFSDNMFN